jgi:hypothetical protein
MSYYNGLMGGVYFDGDPATDSARRHMERVLKGEDKEKSRRWPLLLAALGGGAVWFLFRSGQDAARTRPASDRDEEPQTKTPVSTAETSD